MAATSSSSGDAYLLPAFAAAFLGSTTIKPGQFNVWGSFVAVYFLVTGVTGLQLLGYTGSGHRCVQEAKAPFGQASMRLADDGNRGGREIDHQCARSAAIKLRQSANQAAGFEHDIGDIDERARADGGHQRHTFCRFEDHHLGPGIEGTQDFGLSTAQHAPSGNFGPADGCPYHA